MASANTVCQEAEVNQVCCKVQTQVRLGSLVAGSQGTGSNSFPLCGSTKDALGVRCKEMSRNENEPTRSLVNMKSRRATRWYFGEASNHCFEPGLAMISSGVSGATRLEGFTSELERSTRSERLAYKRKQRNSRLTSWKSDKPIVATTPKTAKLWTAKGLDLNNASARREGRGDWR